MFNSVQNVSRRIVSRLMPATGVDACRAPGADHRSADFSPLGSASGEIAGERNKFRALEWSAAFRPLHHANDLRLATFRASLPWRTVKRRKRRAPGAAGGFLALGLFLLTETAVPAAPATLTAHLDRESVAMGECVTLTLTFEGASPKGPPGLPALPNVQASYSGQSSSFSFVNGESTASISYTYTLVPTQPGDVTIPALQTRVDGQVLTSQPVKLKVVKNQAEAGADAAQNSQAFVKLVVPKAEVYVGESFPVEVDLYFQNIDQNSLHMPQLQAEGFSLGPAPRPSQSRTQIGNAVYNLLIFKSSATAAKAGNLSLGLADYNLTLLVANNNPRRRDPFDPFGFFGSSMQQRPIALHCDPQIMRVLPLPNQNVPASFNGAVGTFSLTVTAGPTNLAVGDPITLKVQIQGQGLLDGVLLPPQPDWRDFTSYPPSSKVESSDALGLTGVKSFEQVIIPQNHEVKMLPPFQFSFFDPNQKSYRTLSGPAVALNVRPTASAFAPISTNAASPQSPPPVDDIVHIKARLDEVASARSPLIQQRWFLAMQAFPVLTWLSLLVLRKRNESLANNPKLRRQRQVAQRIRDGLKALQPLAAAQNVEEFFATFFRLLQEQLGERLDLPASAITEAVIDEHLRARHLPEETLAELHALFQTCNLARYAPNQTSQELAALIPRLESALARLRSMK